MIDKRHFYVDSSRPTPLYYQIQENLAELIDLNVLEAGEALPSERELSKLYAVSRLTVRQAIDNLVARGLIKKQHGVGTFVAEKSEPAPFEPTVVGFTQRMQTAGLSPSTQVIETKVIQAPPLVYHKLDVRANDEVLLLKRMRLVNDEPLMIEKSYLPLTRYPDLQTQDFAGVSLYQLLEDRYRVQVYEAEQTLEPTLLKPSEATLFGIDEGQPAMLVRIVAYTQDRTPIEFSKSVVRGDKCRFYFRVNTHRPIVS